MSMITLAERNLLPDCLIRYGIRKLLKQRLKEELANNTEHHTQQFLNHLRQSPIAIETTAANTQHYEVPAAFYQYALGEHLKYSSCYWDEQTDNLNQAEARMLALTVQRAELMDGQHILELGCGWGSLTLWMAENYPNSHITAVSNSNSQRQYIQEQANQRNLNNIDIITCDVNQLALDKHFDRIVSVEMFEHMRNYDSLLNKVASWLKEDGKLFVHIFCHRLFAYPFETDGEDNWMGQYFFTGGLMPAKDTLLNFQKALCLQHQWDLSGTHYQKTADAWLHNMDNHLNEIREVFNHAYGNQQADVWIQRWRIFFMSCSELFGYKQGNEWMVAHYLFIKRHNVI